MKKILCCLILSIVSCPVFILSQEATQDWRTQNASLFSTRKSPRFTIHYIENEFILQNLDRTIDQREKGYQQIKEFLNLEEDISIQLYLFPSAKMKFEVTGHRGYGWGYDNVIAEVFNDSVEVDPYHEMMHVLAYKLGKPPAMLDEGLAVYLAERLGDNSLVRFIGYPGKSVEEVIKILESQKPMIPIVKLYEYKDIGDAPDVVMAYMQSASFVKYLVQSYGKDLFLQLFSHSKPGNHQENLLYFLRLYGTSLRRIEKEWLISLCLSD